MALSYCKCLARNHDIKWDSVSCLNTCHVRCHVRPWWALHDLHERRFIWSLLHRFLQSFQCVLTFCYMCDVQTVCAALLSELYPLMRSKYCCWYEAVLLFEDIFHFLLHDSLFIFCRASHNEMARRTRTRSLCLFYLWNQVSSSFLWMLRECVLIVPLHNSVLSFPAGLWPRWPTPALVHWCRASKQRRAAVLLHGATVGQSPRGGVFSNNPAPNPVSELNCVFVIFSLWMSVCLCCGSMDFCFWKPRVAFISTVIVVPLSHSSVSRAVCICFLFFFFNQMQLLLVSLTRHETWAFVLEFGRF